jgi:hypothetical protein
MRTFARTEMLDAGYVFYHIPHFVYSNLAEKFVQYCDTFAGPWSPPRGPKALRGGRAGVSTAPKGRAASQKPIGNSSRT